MPDRLEADAGHLQQGFAASHRFERGGDALLRTFIIATRGARRFLFGVRNRFGVRDRVGVRDREPEARYGQEIRAETLRIVWHDFSWLLRVERPQYPTATIIEMAGEKTCQLLPGIFS